MFQKTKGVIAAGNKYTAEAGKLVMESGGNVFDAMVAACFTSFVTEPTLTSAGGSGFLLAHNNNKTLLYDFFSQTPLKKRPIEDLDFFPIDFDFGGTIQQFHIGLGSMTVPGNIKGLFKLHSDLGRLPFKEVLQPAIDAAKNGYHFSAYTVKLAKMVLPVWENVNSSDFFFSNNGTLLKENEMAYAKKMGDTFEYFANNGIKEFYEGEIAQSIANDCYNKGGYLTRADFANYEVLIRKPLQFTYNDKTIFTNPPPSIGGTLIKMGLKMRAKMDDSSHSLNSLVQTMRNINQKRKEGLDKEIMALGFNDLSALKALGNTTHISIIDNNGNAASTTTTHGEGSGYCAPNTGIIINNILGEADLMPDGFHNWPCNQRIASMMSPTVLLAEKGIEAALGSGGSNRIRTAIMQVIENLVKHKMPVTKAVAQSRMHLEFNSLEMEPGFTEQALKTIKLQANETINTWKNKGMFFGGVHCATIKQNGELDGSGDERREGIVLFSN